MTHIDLEAIEARWSAALPGPWTHTPEWPTEVLVEDERGLHGIAEVGWWHTDNPLSARTATAEAIANAPTDIAALIAWGKANAAALHAATQERDQQAARVGELTAAIEAFLSNGHLDRMADGSACYIVRGELPYVLLQEALEACATPAPRAEVE